MIEFIKDVKKLLPYDRRQYIEFMDEDFDLPTEWCGISFQLVNDDLEIGLQRFLENYESLFKNVILRLDQDFFWIVNHDTKDLIWLPNSEENLPALRILFKQYEIPNNFKGALTFAKDDLFKFSKELLSYPFSVFNEDRVLYKNLDISHGKLQFIIKISGHWNIDFLSTNKKLLREIVSENSTNKFIVKEYNGNSLWS